MRQKFSIQRNDENNELNIKEYANLDREYKNKFLKLDQEFFSLLCEETYDKKKIMNAIEKGKENLILTLRTPNMYPINIYSEKIADSVIGLYDSGNSCYEELLFDDKEFLGSIANFKALSAHSRK